ncbi:MAG TPA: hypothetical protein VFH61_02165 [Thermoleophilia bacterium]|nr:hypothetical protein [Thermoleophilia bacterium]
MTPMTMALDPDALYICDNGATYCGRHTGISAQTTGRDISGRAVTRVTERIALLALDELGELLSCERCGRVA